MPMPLTISSSLGVRVVEPEALGGAVLVAEERAARHHGDLAALGLQHERHHIHAVRQVAHRNIPPLGRV